METESLYCFQSPGEELLADLKNAEEAEGQEGPTH